MLCRRRVLYWSTHSKVGSSTSARGFSGPVVKGEFNYESLRLEFRSSLLAIGRTQLTARSSGRVLRRYLTFAPSRRHAGHANHVLQRNTGVGLAFLDLVGAATQRYARTGAKLRALLRLTLDERGVDGRRQVSTALAVLSGPPFETHFAMLEVGDIE